MKQWYKEWIWTLIEMFYKEINKNLLQFLHKSGPINIISNTYSIFINSGIAGELSDR